MALTIDEREITGPGSGAQPGDGGSPFRQILVPVRSPGRAYPALAAARICALAGGVLRLVHVRTCDRALRSTARFYRETPGEATAVLEEALLMAWACGGPRATTAVVDARREDVATGAFTRIGPTGASQFFMDLTFDPHGNMLGETSTLNPSAVPAMLYRINPAIGTATKLFNLTGSSTVMGQAFGRDGKLYATDNPQNPGLYRIGTTTGFETAIAALPFGFSSGLELMGSGPR